MEQLVRLAHRDLRLVACVQAAEVAAGDADEAAVAGERGGVDYAVGDAADGCVVQRG